MHAKWKRQGTGAQFAIYSILRPSKHFTKNLVWSLAAVATTLKGFFPVVSRDSSMRRHNCMFLTPSCRSSWDFHQYHSLCSAAFRRRHVLAPEILFGVAIINRMLLPPDLVALSPAGDVWNRSEWSCALLQRLLPRVLLHRGREFHRRISTQQGL